MKVAVAVIIDKAFRVLITRRALTLSHGGYWEFPGGKLEAGESGSQALTREILEEVGLTINDQQLIGEIEHYYGEKYVHLLIYLIKDFSGAAYCREGQMDLSWTPLDELSNYSFPEANKRVIEMIHSALEKTST